MTSTRATWQARQTTSGRLISLSIVFFLIQTLQRQATLSGAGKFKFVAATEIASQALHLEAPKHQKQWPIRHLTPSRLVPLVAGQPTTTATATATTTTTRPQQALSVGQQQSAATIRELGNGSIQSGRQAIEENQVRPHQQQQQQRKATIDLRFAQFISDRLASFDGERYEIAARHGSSLDKLCPMLDLTGKLAKLVVDDRRRRRVRPASGEPTSGATATATATAAAGQRSLDVAASATSNSASSDESQQQQQQQVQKRQLEAPIDLNSRLGGGESATAPAAAVTPTSGHGDAEKNSSQLSARSSGPESRASGSDLQLQRPIGRAVLSRLAKKTDWNALIVKLAKVFLQYFLDLILNDMFGTTGTRRSLVDSEINLKKSLHHLVRFASGLAN